MTIFPFLKNAFYLQQPMRYFCSIFNKFFFFFDELKPKIIYNCKNLLSFKTIIRINSLSLYHCSTFVAIAIFAIKLTFLAFYLPFCFPKEIAELLNYASIYSFSKSFKAHFGISPAEYNEETSEKRIKKQPTAASSHSRFSVYKKRA